MVLGFFRPYHSGLIVLLICLSRFMVSLRPVPASRSMFLCILEGQQRLRVKGKGVLGEVGLVGR